MTRFDRIQKLLLATSISASVFFTLKTTVEAEVKQDRFSAAGYFRIMTRPDFQGGDAKLGLWNLYGRLLNEGPWGALELKLDILPPTATTNSVWTTVHAKIEGGSFANAERRNGSLGAFAATQLYVKAGNILFDHVVWQLGTLDSYFGDLGLYDMRPAQLFFETVGLSLRYDRGPIDFLFGIGDSGFFVRGFDYSTILTIGSSLRLRAGSHLEFGFGGQIFYEPPVRGNRFAPHRTTLPDGNIAYEDYRRGEIVANFLEKHPGQESEFPKPEPVAASSFKAIGYLGFGQFGPVRWNNFFINVLRRHPQSATTETVEGRDFHIYIKELTDERYEINFGNELQLALIPRRFDATCGVLFGHHFNLDNTVVAGEDNRTFYSLVLRLQYYVTETVHLLGETSWAQERSRNGNLWRAHYNSIFASSSGRADSRGLQFGDLDQRNTWQLKTGIVLNPVGIGVYTRPSLRLMYGLQRSNMHNAFGNNFVETLDQFNEFVESADRHWHSVIAIETEAWF